MPIYNRICALPEYERSEIFKFYERILGSVHVRETLGECHFQAVEYCTSMSRLGDYEEELKKCLNKVQYFYMEGDPTRQAIDLFFAKAANNPKDYWNFNFWNQFFEQELGHLLNILVHKQTYLNTFIAKVKQAHNFSYPDVQAELNQILNRLEEDLNFIIVQLNETRFAGVYIDAFDGIFETELIKLINIYSLLLIELAGLYQKFHQQNVCKRLYDFIERLLQSSLIIRHPTNKNARAATQKMSLYKFVLKTNSNLKFQADFFAPILLKNVEGKIKCKCLLVNEGVANTLIERPENWTPRNMPETCATLTNHTVDFKEDGEKGYFSAKFERLTASNVTRCERRITDIVTDSKVVFAFHCNFKYGYRDIEVRGYSQPVVFVVHVVQESSAHGTMSWHNALTKHSHSGRGAPQEAPYAEVAKILNDRFFYTTGRGLTLENLKHIRREPFVDHAGIVTAKSFLKDVLQEFARNHQKEGDIKETKEKKAPSFWDWFYECNKLTVSSFKENWKRGLVEGFIPKKMAENLLLNEPNGSFIIRFSQSMLGVVSFDNNYGLAPFYSSSEFRDKTLDRCILSHQSLTYLYPKRKTEDVFASSPPAQQTPSHPGYAKVTPTYIIPKPAESSPTGTNGYSDYSYASPSPYSPGMPGTPFTATGSQTGHSTNPVQYFMSPNQPQPSVRIPNPVQMTPMGQQPQPTQNMLPAQFSQAAGGAFPGSPQQSYANIRSPSQVTLSSPSVSSTGFPAGNIGNGNGILQPGNNINNNLQFDAFGQTDTSMDYQGDIDTLQPFECFNSPGNIQRFTNPGAVTPAYASPNSFVSSPNYQTNFHQQSSSYN